MPLPPSTFYIYTHMKHINIHTHTHTHAHTYAYILHTYEKKKRVVRNKDTFVRVYFFTLFLTSTIKAISFEVTKKKKKWNEANHFLRLRRYFDYFEREKNLFLHIKYRGNISFSPALQRKFALITFSPSVHSSYRLFIVSFLFFSHYCCIHI